jgi:hypothetical protein
MSRIKKIITYENIQLENTDGTRPKGSWARLQKTFTDANFDMSFVRGVGVKLVSKEDITACHFIIPYSNLPFIIVEPGSDENQNEDLETRPVRTRRRRGPSPDPVSEQPAAQHEGSPW